MAAILSTTLENPTAAKRLIRACDLDEQQVPKPGSDERAIEEIARWVAAPFFIGFTSWVLSSATAMGIDRIYFLARDGHLPWLVAQHLASASDGSALAYLFVSRRACSIASTASLTTEDVLWLLGNSFRLGPSAMLDRLELQSEDAWSCFAGNNGDRALGVDETVMIAERIATGAAGSQLLERACELRPNAIGYLQSTGFLDDGAVGLVDLGGMGSHIRALASLRGAAAGPVTGFLASRAPLPATIAEYRQRTTLPDRRVDPMIQTYFPDAETGTRQLSSAGTALLQTFCATDHGTVLAYRTEGANSNPVLDDNQVSKRASWDVRRVHSPVLQTVMTLAGTDTFEHLEGLRASVMDSVEDLAHQPTLVEARAWGAHPMESTSPHIVEPFPFARPYRWRDIPKALRAGSLPGGWTRWQAGSLRLSPSPLRQLLRGLLSLRRGERRLRAHLLERGFLGRLRGA